MKSDGWVLCRPNGTLVPDTFDTTKDECWGKALRILERYKWMGPFWGEWDALIREAEKHGYTVVRVNLTKAR